MLRLFMGCVKYGYKLRITCLQTGSLINNRSAICKNLCEKPLNTRSFSTYFRQLYTQSFTAVLTPLFSSLSTSSTRLIKTTTI